MEAIILDTVGNVDVIWDGTTLRLVCCLQIDGDGSGGNLENDPDFQDDTTLHGPDGKAINARLVPGFVLPPRIIKKVPQIVLGSEGFLTNALTGLSSPFVVHDVGPNDKLGEGTICLAQRVGVNSNPVTGGESRRVMGVTITPGKAARIDGIQYALRPYRS